MQIQDRLVWPDRWALPWTAWSLGTLRQTQCVNFEYTGAAERTEGIIADTVYRYMQWLSPGLGRSLDRIKP
jgi:hypothetical protein